MGCLKKKRKLKTMKSLLSRELPCSRRHIYVSDKDLTPIADKDFGRFLVEDVADIRKYQKNVFECNLFTLNLFTNAKNWFLKEYGINPAVGMLWTAKTTYKESCTLNFYVNPTFSIHVIESRSDHKVFLTNYGKVTFTFI